ncbi:MAG: cyclic pyranopterin monophosphate synthase MoaC [Betaproteobacteria bacterium]|nr:cyclic pyranopterin monophosphate synthase MoaC [Betaproteobacteria bacterium]
MSDKKLAHLDDAGNPCMVETGHKQPTDRQAVAAGSLRASRAVIDEVDSCKGSKGSVVAVATIAAIQAAKRTSDFIPLCHPLALTGIDVDFATDRDKSLVHCKATVLCTGRTGVEMEALLAVHVGLLTVYDMCKSVDRGMEVVSVRLLAKSGGVSGDYQAPD